MTKRFVDVVVGALAIVVLSPVLAVLGVLVRLRFGKPVLFRQERAGLSGQSFTVWKFRTMTDARDESGERLPDDQRLTRFGVHLRSLSLDELPELWNIVKGNMSLVGPRPLPVAYLPRYTAEESRRHDVRPGLTGWAQVNGRNTVDWDARLALDVWYVDHQSLWLDLRILARTIRAVVSRSGISAEGHATMTELRKEPHGASRARHSPSHDVREG